MDKYYLLRNSTINEIGESYPQCKGIPEKYDFNFYERPNSMTKLNSDGFPTFQPELIFELENNALLTNVLSPNNIMAKGFIIDSKVKRILEFFNLCKHKYFKTEILNSIKKDYQWIHLLYNDFDSIDFTLSTFFTGYFHNHKLIDLNINSLEEFFSTEDRLKKQEVPSFVFFSKLVLKEEYSKMDLFCYSRISMNTVIISERLKRAFDLEEITGLETTEL